MSELTSIRSSKQPILAKTELRPVWFETMFASLLKRQEALPEELPKTLLIGQEHYLRDFKQQERYKEFTIVDINEVRGLLERTTEYRDREPLLFKRIVLHQALHMAPDPETLVLSLALLLSQTGRLFISSIPNVNKFGRYLASEKGQVLEEAKGKKLNPFMQHYDFAKLMSMRGEGLDDALLLGLMLKLRAWGFNSYLCDSCEKHAGVDDFLIERP